MGVGQRLWGGGGSGGGFIGWGRDDFETALEVGSAKAVDEEDSGGGEGEADEEANNTGEVQMGGANVGGVVDVPGGHGDAAGVVEGVEENGWEDRAASPDDPAEGDAQGGAECEAVEVEVRGGEDDGGDGDGGPGAAFSHQGGLDGAAEEEFFEDAGEGAQEDGRKNWVGLEEGDEEVAHELAGD